MTYLEIMEKVNEKIAKAGLLRQNIAKELQVSASSLTVILRGKSCMLYFLLDLLDEVGLELVINDKVPVKSHQDLIDYINRMDFVKRQVAAKANVLVSTIDTFVRGDNVQVAKVFVVLDAMGIELRIL